MSLRNVICGFAYLGMGFPLSGEMKDPILNHIYQSSRENKLTFLQLQSTNTSNSATIPDLVLLACFSCFEVICLITIHLNFQPPNTNIMTKLSDAIKDDHRKIEQAYRYILTSTTVEDKVRWRNELSLELARHCISEEQVLLPILTDRLADGESRSARNHTVRESVSSSLTPMQDGNGKLTHKFS